MIIFIYVFFFFTPQPAEYGAEEFSLDAVLTLGMVGRPGGGAESSRRALSDPPRLVPKPGQVSPVGTCKRRTGLVPVPAACATMARKEPIK